MPAKKRLGDGLTTAFELRDLAAEHPGIVTKMNEIMKPRMPSREFSFAGLNQQEPAGRKSKGHAPHIQRVAFTALTMILFSSGCGSP